MAKFNPGDRVIVQNYDRFNSAPDDDHVDGLHGTFVKYGAIFHTVRFDEPVGGTRNWLFSEDELVRE